MELLVPRDNKPYVDNMIRHQVLSKSDLEHNLVGTNPRISEISEDSNNHFLTPYTMSEERNTSRSQKYDMGCKCGLGTMGKVTKDGSRIVDGYEPETRSWMVFIEVN